MRTITSVYKKILTLIVLLLSSLGFSQNLLNNGGFETGTVIGFFVNAAAYTQLTGPFSGTTAPGNYAFTTNPQTVNTASFIAGGDHTTGTGNMLVFDGNTAPGVQNFWEAGTGGSGVCGLTIGSTYTFSYWIKSIATTVTNAATQANIGVQILPATAVTLVSGSAVAPLPASGWQQVVYTFVASGNCANIKLFDNNKSAVGNDFAIDDMSVLAPLVPLTISITTSNSSCPNLNNGTITGAGSNGVQPYVIYNLTGTVTQANTTGYFTGLPPGTYAVSVTDSGGTTVSQPNIIITEPTDITTSTNTSICAGGSTTLTVSGGTGPYNWTASPADATLVTPSANPTVSPAVTTTYTVSPSINTTINLINNGNFSSGNVGFNTNYQYFTPSNAGFVQRAYGIVTNPNSWEVGFSAACVDHTSGTGLMMVVDGSNLNAGNDLVWGQDVTVTAGQNYTFSYWVQTVSAGSPAIIRTKINGVTIGTGNASATVCGWTQYSYVWNSGASTLAQIQLFDINVAPGGNDFTLDDIAFTTNTFCNVSKTITVTVNPSGSPVISCGTSTASSVVFNWGAVTGATGYTISYTINSGTPISGGSITTTTFPVTGLNANDSVTITVTPTGGTCFTSSSQTCIAVVCVPPNVSASTFNQPDCTVKLTGSSTTLGVVMTWNGPSLPANSPNPATATVSGAYTLTAFDPASGCSSSTTVNVTIATPPSTPVITITQPTCTVSTGSIVVTSPVGANLQYSIGGTYQSSPTFSNLAPGSYSVTVKNTVSGCISNATPATINAVPNPPTATPFLFCDAAATTATSVGFDFNNAGQTSFTYTYTIGSGAPVTGTFTAPSHYDVPVTSQGQAVTFTLTWNGLCTPSQTITCFSTCTTTPVLNITNPAAVCSPNTVDITQPAVTAGSTGGGVLTYWTNATATIPLVNPTAIAISGTYYIKSSLGNCSDINPVVVTINPTPTLTITNPVAVCSPNTVNITLPAVTAGSTTGGTLTYWTNATATTALTTPTAVATSGTYYIKLTVGNCFDIEPVTVTINPTPALTITNPPAACSPNTVNITLPAVTAGSTGGGTLSYWTNAAATTALANPTAIAISGTYYIKSTLGACSDIEPVVVTITTTPVLTITNSSAVCSPNTVNITLPAVTAGSTGGGTLSYWTNAVATTSLATPTAVATSGTYYIKSTVGTCFDIEPVTVTINPTPVLTITTPATVCSPNTVNITLPAVTAGSTGGGTLSYWTNATATTTLATPTAVATSGTYYIKSTLGACSDIEPVVVTITTTPVLTIHNPPAVCSPNTVDITLPAVTAGSTGGGTLTYWFDAAATIGLANPTAVAASGTYYIKSTVGTCFDIEPVVVTITTTPVLTITNPNGVCSPNTVNITLASVTAGSTGGGVLTYWTNAAATTPLANPAAVAISGTYYIKSTVGTCFDIEPLSVTITTTPVLNITSPASVCAPGTVDITLAAVTAGSTGGGTLSYWTNATATIALSNPTAVTTSGTYYIKSTVGTCFDIEPVTVTISPTPVLSIHNPAGVCAPNTVDITLPAVTAGSTGAGTLSYWTNATATTALANPTAVATSGIYYIKSTLGSCFDIEPVTVTISNPNLVITNPAAVCAPSTVDITLPAVTAGSTGGGVLSYWTNATATNPLANAAAVATSGTYYIKSTAGTCFDIEPVTVTINANFVISNPLPLQMCDPNNDGFETFDLTQTINTITGGNPGYTVTFHETQTDANVGATPILVPSVYNNINPWLQTIYIRVISSTSPCSQTTTLQLIVNPTPVATTPQPYELCDYTGSVGYEAFNLNSIIPEILGSIDPTLNTVTFYTTLTDAQDATNAIPNPGNYTNIVINTQPIYVRVETIATGCYDTVVLQLVVNPLPNSTQPNYPQYSLCDVNQDTPADIGFEFFDLSSRVDDILLGQTGMDVTIYPSLGDAQNGTNVITNLLAYQNAIQYVQTLGIRITNSLTGCYVISTIDIRVEPLPVLTPPTAPYTLCDENQDGYTTFDLTTLLPGLLNGITTYTVSFHETEDDAEINGTTIPNPASYININAFMQILYVRAEDNSTHCVSIIPIELNVNPSPIAPVFLDDISVCDDDSNPQSASTLIDLTQRTPDILAQQPLSGSNYTVTYYNSQADAQTGAAVAIINDTNYFGTHNEIIWVRVENNVTGCFNVGSFQLEINIPLLLITPTPLNVCDDDTPNENDQFHVFDLTVKDLEINQGTNYLVTYYPSLLDAQNNTNVITVPTAYTNTIAAVQTLGVVVSSPLPANCQSVTTLDIRVLPIPTLNTNPPALAPKCDDTNPGDMEEVFDLTLNESYIANGDPNLTFSYYETQADAAVPQNPIPLPAAASVGGNVWIRVENTRVDYLGNHCYVLVEQALTVNPLPTVEQPLPPFRACDDNADGFTVFNLADPLLAPQILGALQATTDYSITYYLTQAGANPLTNTGETPLPSGYTNATANAQTIYIRVTNNATGCVNATGVLDLVVEDYATATSPATYTLCDEDPNAFDGVIGIDLNQFTTTVLGGQDPAIFLISYYDVDPATTTGAVPLTAAQLADYQAGPDTDTVWAMVENSSNSITPYCSAVAPINIVIERRPNPQITTANGMTTICVDFTDDTVIRSLILDSGITNPADYTFEWYLASDPTNILSTGPTYTVDDASPGGAPRDYVVHVTNNFAGTLGCDYTSDPFTVIQSGPAVIGAGAEPGYVISEAFSDNQSITVNVVGYGTYQYSLDDGPRQDSNVFTNVTFTPHIIHVWDVTDGVANSCEELIIQFAQTIDYPHYFTPNGDGIHDTWNIVGLSNQPSARIYIFDRYGKLLKQISSAGNGWDGTYNGRLLPADDYWFSVEFVENATVREFKAHFTLKR